MKKDFNLDELLNKPITLSEKFHHRTRIKELEKEIDTKDWPEEWKKVYFKGYPRFTTIILPKPQLPKKVSLKKAFEKRSSLRVSSKTPLSEKKLSTLLFYSAGFRKKNSSFLANRFYPSAGSRYPLETYIISINTQLPKGLYHYYPKSHSLEELLKFKTFNSKKYFGQKWTYKTQCFIIITAIFRRTTAKYFNRGYRYVLIEAGHLGQNVYLVSDAFNLSCCAIGGYADNNLENLLDIDGVNESVVYVLAISEKKQKKWLKIK